MTETQAVETLGQEENLALLQLCLDRHLPDIANNVKNWEDLLLHNIKFNVSFKERFIAIELAHYKQQQFEFLKLWKSIFQNKATYCNLCENFRSTQNTKAEIFTRQLSISSLKEIIKGIINSNHDVFINELDAKRVLDLIKKEGLFTDDEVETIEDSSNEQKKCKCIFVMLKRSSSICFQKFIMLLSENHLHITIVAKILEDLKKNEIYHFLPSSLKLESGLGDTSQVIDGPTSSRKRKREVNQGSCERDLTVQQSKYFKPSELSIHFTELLENIINCLKHYEVPRLITKFNVLMADHASRIRFFPQKLLRKLGKCHTVEDLFVELSPYMSWQRLHVLQLVVDASKCEEAKKLLVKFKSKIDESRSVMEYDFGPPCKRIVPASNSSEALFCTKSATDDMPLHDANEIKRALADSTGVEEHSFELTAVKNGSIILYWLVVRSVIGLIIEGVHNNLSLFYNMGIVEVCIDPGVIITTVPSVRTRSLSYLTGLPTEREELSSAISKNLDLLMHCQPPLSSEQLDVKLKVKDLQVQCHMLNDKADGDILTFKGKVKQLEDSKKRADEEAKLKLSQIQSIHDEMESRLSVVEAENVSLKAESKKLIDHVSTAKQQARQKESELKNVNEKLIKEIASLKEEKGKLKQLEDSKKRADEEAKLKLSQIQSIHDEMESKLSVVEAENVSLKAESKKLINHVSTAKEQARQKESELKKVNETNEKLIKEIVSLKEEKMSVEKGADTAVIQSSSVEDPEKYTSDWRCSLITSFENIHFGRPDAIAIGPNHELLICDYKHQCVFVLDSELNLLNTLGTTGDGRLTHPNGIAVDQDGTIAVSDYRFHQVKKFLLTDGKCICSIGDPGPEDGNFDYPRGLAFSSDGSLYVMDWGNSRIQVFNKQNEFSFKFGIQGSGPSEFDHPTRIALDGSDNVYVANYNSSTIAIFTNFGKFVTSIPTNKPFAIAVTSKGYIFADDNDKNHIKMWNPKHQLIGQFGKEGDQKGEFNFITDMAIGKNGLYVVDAKNKRLQLIEEINW